MVMATVTAVLVTAMVITVTASEGAVIQESPAILTMLENQSIRLEPYIGDTSTAGIVIRHCTTGRF